MKWQNLKTSTKIMAGSGLILLLMVALLAWVTYGLGSTVTQAKEVGKGNQLQSDLLQREVDHLNWANHVATLLMDNTGKPFNVETDPTQCKFGKWFYSDDRKHIASEFPDLKDPIDAMETPHRALHASATSIKAALDRTSGSQGRSEASAIFLTQTLPSLQQVQTGLKTIREQAKKHILTEDGMLQSATTTRQGTIIIGVAAILIGIVVSWFIARSIAAPILLGIQFAQVIATGDFSRQLNLDREDEVGQLAKALDAMTLNLRDSMLQIQESALAISQASGEISMGNTDLSRRTEEQAASLEETASSMEQITSNVNQTADNAKSANQESTKARQVAQDGGTAVTQVIAAMEAINQSSARINEIIGVVDEIAFQTNLLALNAAVEAARAGEQGRGFAVVAAEVRNLAKRSADAAKEIKGLIRESVAKSEDGNKVAAHAGETIQEVVANVQRVTALVSDIANATQEQSTGLNEINKAVVSMDEVTQQNAALVEEAAAAAESLDSQAHTLNEIVGRFKIGVEAHREAPRVRTTVTSQRARQTANPARAALKRPPSRLELAHAKPPVAMPKNGDDGQWEAF